MADQDAQDRNLPASARKIQKAREDGQVARSKDVGHFVAVAVAGLLLVAFAPLLMRALETLLAGGLRFSAADVQQPQAMFERLGSLFLRWLWLVIPLGMLMALAAVASCLAVGGWNWTLKPLAPKFHFLDPLQGLGRLVSKQQLIDTARAVGLASVLIAIGGTWLSSHLDVFSSASAMPLPDALSHLAQTMKSGLVLIVIALALFAVIDAPLQKRLLANKLKMSHQELKQEHKQVEGNTEVKAKMKVRMREMSRRRMLAAVPKADLVVMNPTHYAVALKYDEAKMAAPRVVAKGADLLAMAIRDSAKASSVPVLQAPVLARALYAHAEVDREIPAALFSAVAQVLAYVYQLRAALAGRGPMPGELPLLSVPSELDPHNVLA